MKNMNKKQEETCQVRIMEQERKAFTVRLDKQDLGSLRKEAKSCKPKKSLQQHVEGILLDWLKTQK